MGQRKRLNFDEIARKGKDYWREILSEQFKSESDRGIVLVSLALIDELLEVLLRRKLVLVKNRKNDKLFDGPNAPMSNLSSKIILAYRLGMISEEFQIVIDKLRGLRNEFAHSFYNCSFNESSVKDKIDALYLRFQGFHSSIWEETLESSDLVEKKKYFLMVDWITFKIIELISRAERVKWKPLEYGFWNEEMKEFFLSLHAKNDDIEINEKYQTLIEKRKRNMR